MSMQSGRSVICIQEMVNKATTSRVITGKCVSSGIVNKDNTVNCYVIEMAN